MLTRISFIVYFMCVALVNAKSNRIIGGDVAYRGQFQYQIALVSQDERRRMCGAAIIADEYVLTAAHCVINHNDMFYSTKYHVIADSTDLSNNEGVRIDVEKIYVPSTFSSSTKRNDIAVLKLRRGLGLDSNPRLEKINLPSKRESCYVGYSAVVTGYGLHFVNARINPKTGEREEFNRQLDGKLRYALTNVIGNEECIRKRRDSKIGENEICAQIEQREEQARGICSGDSGGPLVSENKIIGIASRGPYTCREDEAPAIYTRVSAFIGFIEKAMKNAKTSSMLVYEIDSDASSSSRKEKPKWPFMTCFR